MLTELTEHELAAITARVCAQIMADKGEDLKSVSISQACGILDVTPKTLSEMPIDKVDLLDNGKLIRYRLRDLEAYLDSRTVKAGKKVRRNREAAA